MSIDVHLLKALTNKTRFYSLRDSIPEEMFAADTIAMIGWFGLYYSKNPEHQWIDLDLLCTMMKLQASSTSTDPETTKANIAISERIVEQLKKPVDDDKIATVVNQLEELRFRGKVGRVLADYDSGEDIDITYEVQQLTEQSRSVLLGAGGAGWAQGNIGDYLKATDPDAGIKLSCLPQLASRIRGLIPGDNIALGAPTDAGKTSLLCKIAGCAAVQAKTIYEGRPLLYLVNEGTAETIVPRIWQAVTGLLRSEMVALHNKNELVPLYTSIVGSWDAIRVQEIHGMSISQVERIIQAHKPYMVITDMTGRIDTGKPNMAEHTAAEYIWNSMREKAAQNKFIHMGTIQVSAEGSETLHPPITALQNSKIGVQTTLDLLMIMGIIRNDPTQENIRGLWTPKNKMGLEGMEKQNKSAGTFFPDKNEWIGF